MKSITKTQKILGIDTNAKTVKGAAQGFMTGIVYLAPSDESGVANTCPHASKGCRAACLFTAGRGSMNNVRNPRIKKTISFFADKASWINQLKGEIFNAKKKAVKNKTQFVARLNGTSDIAWENENIFQTEKETQFYDYTKNPKRMIDFLDGKMPSNYHLTFSKSENNDAVCDVVLRKGGNVAMVFKDYKKVVADGFYNFKGRRYRVVDGDKNDLRFKDPKNCIVALKAKGKALKDTSGFVVLN